MSVSLPTDLGDPMSQSNVTDLGGGIGSNGNYSSPTNGTDDKGSSVLETNSDTASGSTPLIYVLMFIWVIWILLFTIWIPLLVMRNRRVSQWKRSQQSAATNNTCGESYTNNGSRNYKYQRHKESGSQMTISLLLIFATAVGLALSIFANLSCDFVDLDESMTLEWKIESEEEFYKIMNEGGDYIVNTGDTLRMEYYSMGLWALGLSSSRSDFLGVGDSYHDSCFNIAQTEIWAMGWQFQLARAASVTASLTGGLSLLFLFTGCCNASQRGYFHFLTLPFLFATILQALTLFLLDTPYCTSLIKSNNCEMGLGAVSAISASMYWLFCTLACMTPFPPIEATFKPLPGEDESYQLSDKL